MLGVVNNSTQKQKPAIREFKQITMASATKAAMTEKVLRRYVLTVCPILSSAKQNTKINVTHSQMGSLKGNDHCSPC